MKFGVVILLIFAFYWIRSLLKSYRKFCYFQLFDSYLDSIRTSKIRFKLFGILCRGSISTALTNKCVKHTKSLSNSFLFMRLNPTVVKTQCVREQLFGFIVGFRVPFDFPSQTLPLFIVSLTLLSGFPIIILQAIFTNYIILEN